MINARRATGVLGQEKANTPMLHIIMVAAIMPTRALDNLFIIVASTMQHQYMAH